MKGPKTRTHAGRRSATACLTVATVLVVSAGSQASRRPLPRQAKRTEEEIQIPAGKENLPAEQVFKNIEVLKGKPASRLPGMMKALNGLLGVQCTYCHIQGQWEKEEPAKIATRRMFAMLKTINQNYFGKKGALSCWTCHHGAPKPSSGKGDIATGLKHLPADRKKAVDEITAKLGQTANEPSNEAFRNIQVLKGTAARGLPRVMAVFTIVLGTDCRHCHVDDRSRDDKEAKGTTRKMLTMVDEINQGFFKGPGKVSCWTCHQGAVRPEFLPGQPVAD